MRDIFLTRPQEHFIQKDCGYSFCILQFIKKRLLSELDQTIFTSHDIKQSCTLI